ncbi:zinc finger, C2H2 type [Opisthorchis viverrini]|uniref:Zinc finger, C2H2 type n=1 Tax=Opisthorchis viverrini TaxID=6198 RepID=A0A1S8WGW5_OPIVI|nr:zinc finger, C2H2 type [Opisthorchis viverrini]
MVQRSRINRSSSGKMPFDCTGILLSFLFLQNLAVAQNHPVSYEAGSIEVRRQRDEIVSLQSAPTSNATATPHSPEEYGIPCEQNATSEHASKPTGRGDRNNAHQCLVCGKTFQYRTLLMRHQKSHNDHHDFQCDLCSNAYKHPADLRRHMKAKHPICEECGKTFSQKDGLRKHVQTVHSKLGCFTCAQCGKSLSSSFALRKHINSMHESVPKDESLSMWAHVNLVTDTIGLLDTK